ncbi:hypothetical protein [Cucumibacter marinus]|uniref:hypothetical protein n=1 Tax=Cucumibacter marinus TaxID=1121252 RepID=UPI00040BB4E5|nr:hypothetical protein [Cucumibacter marinus]
MIEKNRERDLAFADRHFDARIVENVEDYVADGIVVNLSAEPVLIGKQVPTALHPWRSTMLVNELIGSAERIAVLKISELENFGGVMLRGWQWFGDVFDGFPRQTPLYLSPSDSVGQVKVDPRQFTRETCGGGREQLFEIKLKCWWSPNETDCFIHNEHPFLEVHTQIMGQGRMQKFRDRKASTIYEDVIMTPGFTHEAFCTVGGPNQWVYPWHRYYTDTESVWLAVELHPQ